MDLQQLIEGKNSFQAINRKTYLLFYLVNNYVPEDFTFTDSEGIRRVINQEAVIQALNISKNIPDWMLNIYHMMTFQDEEKKLRFYGPGSRMEFNRILLQGEIFYNEEEKDVWISLQKE